jgi:hypothetical protein
MIGAHEPVHEHTRGSWTVGGICVLGGTLTGFSILSDKKPLKGWTPDRYLPRLFDALIEETLDLGEQPGEVDLNAPRVRGHIRYACARLVDLPEEGSVVTFGERIARLWVSRNDQD